MLNGLQGPTRAQIACAGNCKAMVFALEPSNRARHPKDQALFSAMPCDQSWNFVVSTDQALGNKLNGAVKRRTLKRILHTLDHLVQEQTASLYTVLLVCKGECSLRCSSARSRASISRNGFSAICICTDPKLVGKKGCL